MLALQRRTNTEDQCTVHVLPCRIHHDGATKVTKRYWSPRVEKDGTATSYFRGRKLRGKVVKLPAGYRGVIAKPTERLLEQPNNPSVGPTYTAVDEDIEIAEEQEDRPEPVKILEESSVFDDIVVWGHDIVPTNEDAFVKGIEEWISFAEAIHGPASKDNKPEK